MRFVVTAVAVAVDLVDDVGETRAAVADEKDGNDDKQSDVHRGVLFVGQRLRCREASLGHFCATSNRTEVRDLRFSNSRKNRANFGHFRIC